MVKLIWGMSGNLAHYVFFIKVPDNLQTNFTIKSPYKVSPSTCLHTMAKKMFPELRRDVITPYNVGSVLWRLFSTLEVVQYIGGITSVLWGIASVLWGIASVLWRLFSTVGG